ncbi:hypothetical protein [Neochlamydia sp. AcF95]|nr:hypothetical protein [Neochlamydia sp. AcF95]MBS4170031.1 hypothetical protein [Neochlamydia sp. AcF95]
MYATLAKIYQVQGKGKKATKYNEKAFKVRLRMSGSQYIDLTAINANL